MLKKITTEFREILVYYYGVYMVGSTATIRIYLRINGNSEYIYSFYYVCAVYTSGISFPTPLLLLIAVVVMPLLVIFLCTTTASIITTAVFRLGRSFLRGAVCAGAVVTMACGDVGMVVYGHLQRAAATQLARGVTSIELSRCVTVIRSERVGSRVSAMIDGVVGHILGFQEGVH